jgi:hypothetical protein
MGFFKSIGRLTKAAVGTAMLPVDVVRDTFDFDSTNDFFEHTERRARKIAKNTRKAIEEIDE